MKFLIINRGVPHPESEDAIQKIYLLIQELYNKPEHTVDLALINLPDAYKNYKSLEIQKRDELDFKNEFKKINIDKIFLKSQSDFSISKILRKLNILFSFTFNQFYKNTELEKSLLQIVEKRNPDIIISLSDTETMSNLIKYSKKKSFKIIQLIGQMSHETQQTILENSIRNRNNFLLKVYKYQRQ